MFLGVVGAALVGVIVLTIWFRYHDRHVRHRLSLSRNRDFVPPSEEEPFLPESESASNGSGEVGEKPVRSPFLD